MRTFLSLVLLALSLCSFAGNSIASDCSTNPAANSLLKKSKELFDRNELNTFAASGCRDPGVVCSYSSDCCGASFCRNGYCSDPGVNNIPPGGHCDSSSECVGASMCHNGFCSNPGTNNVPPGGRCEHSSECQGASMCRDNYCTDPGINNIPPGGHCNSSSECMGSSMCRDHFCS
ncbi:MAG: hypothetical protein ACJ763_04030 [Bdellovibrionia bacterium]